MAEEVKQHTTYNFRLSRSSTIIALEEEQAQCSHYLRGLISTGPNDDGQYVLSNFIRYHAFSAILKSMVAKSTSFLFSTLPKECDAMYMIRLYRYLSIDSSLIDADVCKKIDFNETFTPRRARDVAVEAIVGFAMVPRHHHTARTEASILHIIERVLSNRSIFSARLRYHTFAVAHSIFNSKEIAHLQRYHSTTNMTKNDTTDEEEDEHSVDSSSEQIFSKEKAVLPTRVSSMANHLIPLLYASIIGTMQTRSREFKFDDPRESEAKSARAGHFSVLPRQSINHRSQSRLNTRRRYRR